MEDSFELLCQGWRQRLNDRLREAMDSQNPPTLYQPVRYVLEAEGKRIRPILLLLSCRVVGGEVQGAWDAAAAIELLHNFTLVHDDIMDQDEVRRGRPTVHKKWNPGIAILAGDGLFALAYRSLLRTNSPHLAEIAKIFTDGILAICEGQALDLEFEGNRVGLADYMDMIERKTARLLQSAAQIGALIGNADPKQVAAVGQFGRNLGLAFQIQDDLLDVISDEVTLGKTRGSDLRQKKQTYLVVHALSHADAATRDHLNRLLSRANLSSGLIAEFREILEKSGALQAASTAVSDYMARAKESLGELALSGPGRDLLRLLDYISTRKA